MRVSRENMKNKKRGEQRVELMDAPALCICFGKVWKATAEKKKLERMIENVWSEREEENQEK